MDRDEKRRIAQGERLKDARVAAGLKSARAAALEFGWPESSYRAHEAGTRTIGQDDADRYAAGFRSRGASVTGQTILYPGASIEVPGVTIKASTAPPAILSGATKPTVSGRAVQEVTPGPDFEPSDLGNRDIPVLGTAMGGTENDERPIDFWLTGEVENHVVRPKGLLRARNVFALYVGGDSMEPRFEERDMVYVQKTSPGIGDDVVIELHPLVEGGDHPTFIKRLVRRNGSFITVKQYNPPKELEFTVKEIKNLFRVIPLKELMG